MTLDNAKILIGDDSIFARRQLKDMIGSWGNFTFIEAADGQEVIDLFLAEKPDLVLLDIVMPIKDGIAAVEEIIDTDPDAYIIMVSSMGTQTQLRRAIEAGARDFIQKPINSDHLKTIITKRFEGR